MCPIASGWPSNHGTPHSRTERLDQSVDSVVQWFATEIYRAASVWSDLACPLFRGEAQNVEGLKITIANHTVFIA
jgi:hypothetical protein